MVLLCVLILLVLLVGLFFIGKIFANKLVFPEAKSYERCIEITEKNEEVVVSEIESIEHENIVLTSKNGYKIVGKLFFSNDAKGVVVLAHGITWNMIGSYKYVRIFLKRGYHVFVYDHRNHGESGGNDTSFGYYEKMDLQDVLSYLTNRFGKSFTIGLHGESMGAATVLQTAGIDSRVAFVIADCPYSNLRNLLLHRMKEDYGFSLPILLPLVDWYLTVRYGWSIKKASPIHFVKNITMPTLFIHGTEDTYVPTVMSEELYKEKADKKEIFLVQDATHARSFMCDSVRYEKAINEFLNKYGF